MKDKVGFVCLGQAGGNIGYIFEQNKYNCLFVNTSKEDLETLNVKYHYHIKNGEGANHSREKAIQLIKNDYNGIVQEVKDKLNHQQLIYLVGATGGGTASGGIPILLEMLNSNMCHKHFGCICILPALDETPKAHINAFKCYQELSQISKLATVFTLDNNKLDKFAINKQFVTLFDTAIDIPNHINVKGNIDKAELWEMLTMRGNAIISTVHTNNFNNLPSMIIKSWEQNIFADLEKDKQIVYMGLSLLDDINVEDLQKIIGVPYDTFRNYNRDQTVTILTGLSFPETRIKSIIDNLNNNKDTIISSLSKSKNTKITTSLDWIDKLDNTPSDSGNISNLDDILQRYA